MDQDSTGTPNPIAPAGASIANETANETITTTETATETITTTPPTATPTTQPSTSQSKKPKGLIATVVILVILALAGIGTSIYFAIDSNNKSAQISTLESEVSAKEATIVKLETAVSNLETEAKSSTEKARTAEPTNAPEPTTDTTAESTAETTASNEAPTIELISEITETDTTKVYKIGECTADSGAGTPSHFSLKCHVTISGKDALISYHDGDNNILRLSLPKE